MNTIRATVPRKVFTTLFSVAALSAGSISAQLTGETGAHDPSTLIKDGANYYYFATGQGIASRSSTNKTSWTGGASVFASAPAWTTTAVPSFTGFFWAPDVAYFNNKFHLYYSVSSWGTIDSAIGVATTTSLSSPSWTDLGKVVQSDAVWEAGPNTDTTAYNAIDPSIMVDSGTNRVWMSWGSYSSGIMVVEIDPSTGKRLGSSVGTQVANNSGNRGWGSSIEGSAMVQHGGFYYLFVNYGGCCSGVSSTYDIRVGRSASPNGPFLDKNGVDMRDGGGSMFLDDDGKMIGPGHFSVFTESGQDYFGYHYYNGDSNGAPTYGLRNLYWTADAWPSYASVNPNWTGAVNANWSNTANWTVDGTPNGIGQVANFVSNSFARYSVNVDGSGKTAGVINFRGNSSYTIGATNGFAITLDAIAGDTHARINVAEGNHTINAPIIAVDPLGVNVTPSTSTLTLSGSITAPSLTKYGFGTLALNGSNTYTGSVLVRYGTLNAGTGAVISTAGYTSIGANVGESASMILRGNASFTTTADFNVGDTGDGNTTAAGTLELRDNASLAIGTASGFFVGSGYFSNTRADGAVNQSGGTLTVTNSGDGYFIVGGRGSSLAVGAYNLSGGVVNANTNVRIGGQGTGTVNQTGGTFTSGNFISIGRLSGSDGTWNISGGTLNLTNAARYLVVGEAGSGTLNVSGTGAVNTNASVRLGLSNGGAGIVNLNGGTITTPFVSKGSGGATFNFNGGTLRAASTTTTFMQGLTRANVSTGAAKIDTQSFNITIAQPLLHDSALGVTPDGGLTKSGTGTLTLSGANTYTGSTTITAGTLKLNSAAFTPITGASAAGAILNGGKLILDYTSTTSPKALLVDDPTVGIKANAANPTVGRLRTSLATDNTKAIGWSDSSNFFQARYTYKGDINLDGLVTSTDFSAFLSGYGMTSSAQWSNGDFDYSGDDAGRVSTEDFNYLAGNFGATSLQSIPVSLGTTIPEPVGAVLLGAYLLTWRRRVGI